MKINPILIVLIVLILIISVFGWCASAGIGGKKVTVTGTVSYSMWPGPGWGVTHQNSYVKEDDFISSPLWYFPWETKDINVVVELSNGKKYSADGWTGKLNLVLGSTDFSVDVRHVNEGSYRGRIYVYEVEKGFLFGEKTRVLQASTNFEVNV